MVAVDHQRVVAVDRELPWQAGKHALLVGADDAGLAVHLRLRADDGRAKRRANGLVAQAHAQDRQLAGKVPDGGHRHARLARRAGAGADAQARELPGLEARVQLVQRHLVVAQRDHLGAQLAEILHDVEGEAVVVVDHQQLHFGLLKIEQPNAEGTETSQRTQKKFTKDFIAYSRSGGRP